MVRQLPGSIRHNSADIQLTEILYIAGTEIRPTESLRYLGIYLDPDLSRSVYLSQLEVKTTRLIAALLFIAGSTWDISALNLRRIYTADFCLRIIVLLLYRNAILPIRNQHFGRRKQDPETNPAISLLYYLEHRLARNLDMDPNISLSIKTIKPTVTPLWWHPPDSVIAESRDAAIEEHGRFQPNTIFLTYTDRSGYNRGIGAAAVLRRKSCIYLLEQNTTHTVYSAKLAGIELALGLAEAENPIQSTLATDKPRDLLPGHEGIPGNELADEHTKKTVRRATNALINRILVSATKQCLQMFADRHHARRIIASLSKQILQLYTGLYRAWFSALRLCWSLL
ncbi:hypothetical protein BDV40DRAFT_250992 [Aspergillus tamarii]|uniref:RNase H type-1 domain-containing protein n=1 Tax=Aspergillus tamarii TaxID=41984 RepID=A0A5N6VCT3_ASPTM|nr:hypothetical protein BDV40DRAFT_250992 [Aspergillus tamarii]